MADALVDRRGGIHAVAEQGPEPPVAEEEPDRAQHRKRHAGEDELPGPGPGSAGADVDVAKVEKRDDGAQQTGAERHGRVLASVGVVAAAAGSRLRRGRMSSVHARIIAALRPSRAPSRPARGLAAADSLRRDRCV